MHDKHDKRASPNIFIDYNTISKAYKNFQAQTGSIVISRDVHLVENEEWNWDETKIEDQIVTDLQFKLLTSRIRVEEDWQNELVDDAHVRDIRPLSNIYERCNINFCEPTDSRVTEKDQNWMMAAMKEELFMIEKNQTWELVDRPKDRKLIGVKRYTKPS